MAHYGSLEYSRAPCCSSPKSPSVSNHCLLRHSKTEPSISSHLQLISNNNNNSCSSSGAGGGGACCHNNNYQHQNYQNCHYHPSTGFISGHFYGMPSGTMVPASGTDNLNNKLVHRHHYQTSANVPYFVHHHIYSCCSNSSQMISPPSPTISTSLRSRQAAVFEVPALSEETILDKSHNEILAKLNFVLALVDSIFGIINDISNPIVVLSETNSNEVWTDVYPCLINIYHVSFLS